MELRHCRYVVAVAETLHFGRAAERLNISQPPLSQQIQQLEQELGVKLFDRTQRQVQLTAAGEMFVQEARMLLAQAEHAGKVGERLREGEVGQLFIGVAGPADADYFVEIMRAFAKRHPHIRVVIRNLSTAEQVQAIQEKRLHAGFVTPPVDHPDLTFETVLHEPIVVALPRGHALASRTRVPLMALATQPLILFSRAMGPGFFDAIASACRTAGFSLRVRHEVDNLHSAYGLVAAGLGVSFVPAGLQGAPPKGVVLRPLTPPLPRVDCELALAYRRERLCHLVGRFVDTVNDVRGNRRTPRGGRKTRRGAASR
jgi:DNA-binding transcriptional LysR family regulator